MKNAITPRNLRLCLPAPRIREGIVAAQGAVAARLDGAPLPLQLPAWHDLPGPLSCDGAWLRGCYDGLQISLAGPSVSRDALDALDMYDDDDAWRTGMVAGLRHGAHLWACLTDAPESIPTPKSATPCEGAPLVRFALPRAWGR
jgi:hypothetical protein